MSPFDSSQVAMDAARVGLLVARSSVVGRPFGHVATYTLRDSTQRMSADEAARILATRAKPLRLDATLDGDRIALEVTAVEERPEDAAFHTFRIQTIADRSHATGFVTDQYGDRPDLLVVCHGAGQLVWTSVAGLRAWERDYFHPHGGGYSGHLLEHFRGRPPAGLALPDSNGAVAMLEFGWADDVEIIRSFTIP